MPKNNDIEKLNRVFKVSDSRHSAEQKNTEKAAKNRTTKLFESRYHSEKRTGCLGGLMYFSFVMCLAVILAFFAWMAASDALSLNKKNFESTVTLPETIFTTVEEEQFDDDGKSLGMKEVSKADISEVTNILYKAGLIEYKWLFEFFCNISHADSKFDPGEYKLKSTYDYRALVSNMRRSSGGIITVDVTIPEGFTMMDIFKRFDESGVAQYDELMAAAAEANFKYNFIDETDIVDATRLEGFLYPETYQFYLGMEPSSAINKLLQQFYYIWNTDMTAQANTLGKSQREIVTIASMIEKETAEDDERAIVASVIYNRLNSGWQIGFDSTILYLHQDHEGAPDAAMLAEDSPYNTRLHRGLPPTPICNPSLKSILAALNPAQTNYYYFAAEKETGKLHFFGDGNEFNAFVQSQDYDE